MFVKVTLRNAKEDVDKSVPGCKKLLTKQVENLHAISHFNTKHFLSALNCAQDFNWNHSERIA